MYLDCTIPYYLRTTSPNITTKQDLVGENTTTTKVEKHYYAPKITTTTIFRNTHQNANKNNKSSPMMFDLYYLNCMTYLFVFDYL